MSVAIKYMRCSTNEYTQTFDKQIKSLEHINEKVCFKEYHTGGHILDNIELNKMMDYIKVVSEYDDIDVYVATLDRIGRNLIETVQIIEKIISNGRTTIHFVENGISFSNKSDAMSKMQIQMLLMFAEYEKNQINNRCAIGRKKALDKNPELYKQKCGRKKSISNEEIDKIVKEYDNGEITIVEICKRLGVSRPTAYRYVRGDYRK